MEQVKTLEERIKAIPYWYHKIELPDGTITPGWAPIDASKYGIPEDLTGKRVLDIGAWDGYWTWEALKRGAKEVVAIDDFSDDCGHADMPKRDWSGFDLCREAFGFDTEELLNSESVYWENEKGQRVYRVEMSVYDITQLGQFDIVFFFGTLYHLRHPLLALDKIAEVCDGEVYIESAVCDQMSAYHNGGGIGKGYSQGDVVMEFYPEKEYGNNESNWWSPTLQCLGHMVKSVGFKAINAWLLTDNPNEVAGCRGFVYGSKTGIENPIVKSEPQRSETVMVKAIMSIPRLGFNDNMTCAFEALGPLRIQMYKVQGAFWGQCLERGMQWAIDNGADIILAVDYDTLFKPEDVTTLIRLMMEHPEAAAIVPIQHGRTRQGRPLMSIRSKSGVPRWDVDVDEFKGDTIKVATGHFGLTAIRVKDLLDIPHPWFLGVPNNDNQWASGRIDDDIWFWRQLEKHGKTVLAANRIVLGHLELMASWPDKKGEPIFQHSDEYQIKGKPEGAWE